MKTYEKCQLCDGTGLIQEATNFELVDCKKCSGTGNLVLDSICPECTGSGKIAKYRKSICRNCKGTGKAEVME